MSVFTNQAITAQTAASSADVILHAFDWPYQKVTSEAERIAQLGYDSVLVSPAMTSPKHSDWWNRYQPQDYRVISNPLGNTLDFIAMQKALSEHGISLYVDVVFNHMANESQVRSDLTYPNQQTMADYQAQAEHEVFLKPFIESTTFDAYDFPLFHRLLNAFKHDHSMTSLLDLHQQGQCLDDKRAITFAVTHDIPNNDVFRNQMLTPQQEQLVYCYLLGCSDGAPLIYTDLNTSNDLDALGYPRWEQSWHDTSLIKMIQFHKQVHGSPVQVIESTNEVLVILRGTEEKPIGIVAINKGSQECHITLPANRFNVWLGGDDLLRQTLTLPAQSGVMLLA